MVVNFIATLSLSLAIALSWSRFCLIFISSTELEILKAPATTLASTIFICSLGFAFSNGTVAIGTLVVVLSILMVFLFKEISVRPSTAQALSLSSALLTFHIWIYS
jgi:hypothetical protein